MFDKLKLVEKRYNDLNQFLSDPKIISHQSEFQKYAREQSELSPIVLRFQDWQKINRQVEENKIIIEEEKDSELNEMAQEDLVNLETQSYIFLNTSICECDMLRYIANRLLPSP